jgi:hypothetical protein
MLKVITLAIAMQRSADIVKKLQKRHNLDVSEDLKTLSKILALVKDSKLDDDQICKTVLKSYVAQNYGLFAKVS